MPMKLYMFALKDNKKGFYSNPIFLPYNAKYYLELQQRAIANNNPKLKEVENLELYYIGTYDDELATFEPVKEYLLTYPIIEIKKEEKENEISQ